MEKHKNKTCAIAPKVNMDSKTLPDSTTCTLLVERNGEALKGILINMAKLLTTKRENFHVTHILYGNSGGLESVGGSLCSKQFGTSNRSSSLQVSANTGPGNGLISEIFPDDFFENDTRLHGSTALIVNTDAIHPYSQQHSQVHRPTCVCTTLR